MSSQKGRKLLVDQVFSRLTSKEDALQHEINEAAFRIFQCVSDHGYCARKLPGRPRYKNLARVSSTAEIVDCIDLQAKPDQLVPISSLKFPLTFPSLPPWAFFNTFPFGQNEVSHLYVAARHRGINFDTIDFYFGWSVLDMLAHKDDSNGPHIVTTIPEKHTIIVANRKPYNQNLSDIGYQFERLVTGKDMKARFSCINIIEHLHVMKIGDYNVLFCAETDAVDENDRPVEVKTTNPRHWRTRVIFQMISNGSSSLCHGLRIERDLQGVEMHSLSSVAEQISLQQHDIRTLEQNILDGMKAMKDQMRTTNHMEESCFKVSFSQSELKLIPTKTTRRTAVLPPADIVKRLLENEN